MINIDHARRCCNESPELIENYEQAMADSTTVWHIHHRRETIFSRRDLMDIGEYWHRPADELIFLKPIDHHRLHNVGKQLSAATR